MPNRLLIGQPDKSALLLSLMARDADEGFLLIDPTGHLAPQAVDIIPPHIEPFYFDATDKGHCVAFNVLNGVADDERHLIVDLIENVLAILFPEGANTLTRLRANDMLTSTLERLLGQKDTTLLHVLDAIKKTSLDWDKKDREAAMLDIRTRLRKLFRNPLLRNIIGQPHTSFSLNPGKVIIVNLDRTVLGDRAARFLSWLLLVQYKGCAYISDLGFLLSDQMAALLPQDRFTLATDQLPSERSYPALREALLSLNEVFVYRVSPRDAEQLAFQVGVLNARQLTELTHEETMHRGQTLTPERPPEYNRLPAVRKRSRARHTVPRTIVEERIRRITDV